MRWREDLWRAGSRYADTVIQILYTYIYTCTFMWREKKIWVGGDCIESREPKKRITKNLWIPFWFYLFFKKIKFTHSYINSPPILLFPQSLSVQIFEFLLVIPFESERISKYMDASSSSSSCSSSSKGMMDYGNEPHVLAVDDNIIDRKLVEKLLKNSSCKGRQLPLHSHHSLIWKRSENAEKLAQKKIDVACVMHMFAFFCVPIFPLNG